MSANHEPVMPQGKQVTMTQSPEPTIPKTPNELWNFIFISGVGDMCEDLVYMGYKDHDKKRDDKISKIVGFVVGTHQLYRTNCSDAVFAQIKALEQRPFGKWRYRGRLKGLRLCLDVIRELAPSVPMQNKK